MKDRTEFRFYCDVCDEFHTGSHEWWSPHYLEPNTSICLLWDLVHNVLNQKDQGACHAGCCEGECSESHQPADNSTQPEDFTKLSSLTAVRYSLN